MPNILFGDKDKDKMIRNGYVANWEEVNCLIDAKCVKVAYNDDICSLFVLPENMGDWRCWPEEPSFKITNQPVRLDIPRTKYKTKIGGEYKEVEPNYVARFFSDYFVALKDSTTATFAEPCWFGRIELSGGSTIRALSGINADGSQQEPIGEPKRSVLLEMILDLKPVTAQDVYDLIPDAEVAATKKSSSGYGKGEKELDRLLARLSFIQSQILASGIEYKITSVEDLIMHKIEENTVTPDIALKVNLIIEECYRFW